MEATISDLKKLLEDQGQAWEQFKKANNERLEKLERGEGIAEIESKLEKINTDLNNNQQALERLGEIENTVNKLKLGRPEIDGGHTNPEYRAAFEDWFRRGRNEHKLIELTARNAATVQNDPEGGFLVPDEVSQQIDRVAMATVAMRRLARITTIGTSRYIEHVTTTGANAGWVGETESRPDTSNPQLERVSTDVHEVYAKPKASQELLDDAFTNIPQWLAEEVATSFAEKEDEGFITGDGVGKPRGITTYTAVADSSYVWGKIGYIATGAAADFNGTNPGDAFLDAVYALRQKYRMNASWLMNDSTLAKVRKFKDGQGNYLWQPSFVAGQPATIDNKPVVSDDYMPDVAANALAVAIGDFQAAYRIVDRVGIRTLRDPYTDKPFVVFYTTKRVGGQVRNFEALKFIKIASS